MKSFIVLSCLLAVALAKPSLLAVPAVPAIHAAVVPGAPIGPDGRVVDNPEVVQAKSEHAAAHYNEHLKLAQEAVRSADHHVVLAAAPVVHVAQVAPVIAHAHHAVPVVHSYAAAQPAAVLVQQPQGPLDTPEVAAAKHAHAVAHLNEHIKHANEAVRNGAVPAYVVA